MKTVSVQCFGVNLTLQANEPSVLDRMLGLLPVVNEPTGPPVAEFSLCQDGSGAEASVAVLARDGLRLRAGSLPEMIDTFEGEVHLTVATASPTHVFIHAGVVGLGDRAVLIPGSSYSGKTTLVRHLCERGAAYLSDDYAAVDQDGRVHPWPRSLAVRENGGRRRRRVSPSELNFVVAPHALWPELVLFTKYEPGTQWTPTTVTPKRAVLQLLEHIPAVRITPDRVLHSAAKVLERARAFEGIRGSADEIADWLALPQADEPDGQSRVVHKLQK